MVGTLTTDVIAEKVQAIAAAQAGVGPVGITEATHFQADLNYGSLDRVEFVMPLEDTFERPIADEEAEQVQTRWGPGLTSCTRR
ncbi:MAG: acyl carrier protein [Planctomycetota bacterium]